MPLRGSFTSKGPIVLVFLWPLSSQIPQVSILSFLICSCSDSSSIFAGFSFNRVLRSVALCLTISALICWPIWTMVLAAVVSALILNSVWCRIVQTVSAAIWVVFMKVTFIFIWFCGRMSYRFEMGVFTFETIQQGVPFLQQQIKESMQEEILDDPNTRKEKIEASNFLFSILNSSKQEIVSTLFGLVLSLLDIQSELEVVNHFERVFVMLREKLAIKRYINKKSTVMVVYDIMLEIKKCKGEGSEHRLQDLPDMLSENIQEMVRNDSFILQKWKLLDEIIAQELQSKNIIKIQQEQKKEVEKERLAQERQRQLIRIQQQQLQQIAIEEKKRREEEYTQRRMEEEQIQKRRGEEEIRRRREQQMRQEREKEEEEQRLREEEQERQRLIKEEEEEERKKLILEEEAEKERLEEEQMNRYRCQSCRNLSSIQDLIFLECRHGFHMDCLKGYILLLVQSNQTAITCPRADCHEPIPQHLILEFLSSEVRLKQKYQQSLIFELVSNNPDTMAWCPGEGCRSVLYYAQGDTFYRCQNCNISYCLTCGRKQHTDMTCAQYEQRRPASERRINFSEPKLKKCPMCSSWVERSREGKQMRCVCGCRFCYECGGRDCSQQVCLRRQGEGPPLQ